MQFYAKDPAQPSKHHSSSKQNGKGKHTTVVDFCVRRRWIKWNSRSFRVARRASITVALWTTGTLLDPRRTFTFPYFPWCHLAITGSPVPTVTSLLISCSDCVIRTVRWPSWSWPLARHTTHCSVIIQQNVWVSDWVSSCLMSLSTYNRSFWGRSFQAINYTGTDNIK